jgi:amino acid transporter
MFLYLTSLLTGSFFTSARLIYVAGREHYLPSLFGQLHPTRKTPMNATLLQASMTIGYILLGGGFRSLVNFSVVASWAFYFLTVCIPLSELIQPLI